jgi:phage-related protein
MGPARLTEMPVVFYRTSGGAEPVLEWLRRLPAEDRQAIGTDLATVQFGWPIGMPLCGPLGDGLWEVRSPLPSSRIARLVFFVHRRRIGVVHGFIKKTQRTPAGGLDVARRRIKDMPA